MLIAHGDRIARSKFKVRETELFKISAVGIMYYYYSSCFRLSILEQLDDHQALVKQLAKVLEFVLKFDECKMTTPAVQNDFSYYRRTVQVNQRVFKIELVN